VEVLAIPLLLAVGGLLALQAAANVQLAGAMGSPVSASTLQLGIAAGLLLALAAAAGTLGAFGLLGRIEGWHLVGGLGSAIYITAGILLFPRLGAVTTVGLFIAGQMLASPALDATGWLGVPRRELGAAAAAGAVAVVLGAATIVRAQGGRSGGAPRNGWSGGAAAWIALALAAGAALPLQGAVNAQLRRDFDAPIAAGAWSFVIAAAAMALVLAVLAAARRGPQTSLGGLRHVPWWGWLGGACGATYVTSVFLLIPEIGVASTIALTVGGQQIASVFVDRYGLLRLPRRPVTAVRLAGVAILLAGVALTTSAGGSR
jgi:bacterial/archaeal transporter family-2 protein